jgi:hypothetical protein
MTLATAFHAPGALAGDGQAENGARARPLVTEGRKTLFQKVLANPGALASEEPRGDAGKPIGTSLSVLYVYERLENGGVAWLRCSRGTRGEDLFWVRRDKTTEWPTPAAAVPAEKAGRRPSLFFRSKADILEIAGRPDMAARLDELQSQFWSYLDSGEAPPPGFPVVAAEPRDEGEAAAPNGLSIMPVLAVDDTLEVTNLIEVATVRHGRETGPAEAPPPGRAGPDDALPPEASPPAQPPDIPDSPGETAELPGNPGRQDFRKPSGSLARPSATRAWISDRDLSLLGSENPREVFAVRHGALVRREELQALIVSLRTISSASSLLFGPDASGDFLWAVGASAYISCRECEYPSSPATLLDTGLMGEFLEAISLYGTQLAGMNNQLWSSMTPAEQRDFFQHVEDEITLFERMDADSVNWIRAGTGGADDLRFIPLDMLP